MHFIALHSFSLHCTALECWSAERINRLRVILLYFILIYTKAYHIIIMKLLCNIVAMLICTLLKNGACILHIYMSKQLESNIASYSDGGK